jgi:hypothetical protein
MNYERARRDAGERAYYKLPDVRWDDVDPDVVGELRLLADHLALTLADVAGPSVQQSPGLPISPVQTALKMYELANRMWREASGPDRDLRQTITTLRTALAVCWDLYSAPDAEKVTVARMMHALRAQIEDFESELGTYSDDMDPDSRLDD